MARCWMIALFLSLLCGCGGKTARMEQPESKGPSRYVPWGYSVIELDRRTVAIHYHRKG